MSKNAFEEYKNLFLSHQYFFMNKIQIKKHLEVNNVEELFLNCFKSIIENNTCEELNILNKNISLDIKNIEYVFRDLDLISCKSEIFYDSNVIGYYSVFFNKFGKIDDDFFVIF